MRYQSYLSTHPYYLYDNGPFVLDGELNNKNALVKELKATLSKFDLALTWIKTVAGNKIVIYMYTAFSDEFDKSGVATIDNSVQNFDEEDISEMTEVLKSFREYVEKNCSSELNAEIKKMNLLKPEHYIYLSEDEE